MILPKPIAVLIVANLAAIFIFDVLLRDPGILAWHLTVYMVGTFIGRMLR